MYSASPAETLATGGREARAREIERGVTIGRYVVLGPIGAGAMGTVVAAFDPELDRKVAIKVLHDRADKSAVALRREAQALARLSHPNVVGVHDVGMFGDHVFIAMEFVDGTTLRQWSRDAIHSPAEIVRTFIAAGRGLAAAHHAGIVHRDFKPDNVLVCAGVRGEPLRVCVADFGIADVAQAVPSDETRAQLRASSGIELETRATAKHAGLGTPAYMAPEQVVASTVDHRADQYAFCVALFEALAGVRPFEGASAMERFDPLRRDLPRDTPRVVPARLLRILHRGLAFEPDQRWPAMDDLLRALGDAIASAWRRNLIIAGAVTIAAGSWAIARWSGAAVCDGAERALQGTWDDDARTRLRDGFAGSGMAFADVAARQATEALDAWAMSWSASHRDACESTRVRGEQSERQLELRMACLDRARRPVAALVELLATGEADVVERAAFAVADLPDVEVCRDVVRLDRGPAPPTDAATRARVEELRERLAHIAALREAGRFAAELTAATEVFASAELVEHEPIVAAARVELGIARYQAASYDEATIELESGFASALATGDDDLALKAAMWLVTVERSRRRFGDGRRWGTIAGAYLRRSRGDRQTEAALAMNVSVLEADAGDIDNAIAQAERALELRLALDADSPRVAEAWLNATKVYHTAGRLPEAAKAATEAARIFEATLGSEHPSTLAALSNLAVMELDAGRLDHAIELTRKVLALREQTLPPDHPRVVLSVANLGGMLAQAKRIDEARPLLERSLAAVELREGPRSTFYARSLVQLAQLELVAGNLARAEALALDAVDVLDTATEASPVERGGAWQTRANVAAARCDWPTARDAYLHSIAVLLPVVGADHPGVIEIEAALAVARTELGAHTEARVAIDRLLAADHSAWPPPLRVEVLMAAAKVTKLKDRARAHELAMRARAIVVEHGAAVGGADALAEIDAWIAQE